MQQNILKDSNITKIYLIYINANGIKKKEAVKLRFMDSKECYFAANTPVNFVKPKRKSQAEINVYTTDGIYKTKVTIIDTNLSLREVIYNVSIPKTWDFIQLRSSTRKLVKLPVKIKFNDGFEIQTSTYDLSLGGLSFFSEKSFSSIYKKISGILTLEIPKTEIINFPDGELVVETKFVREKSEIENHFGETLYIFKFMNLPKENELILKNFLMKLD